jgi:hypothetical protein
VTGEIREQENRNACVDQNREDVSQCASRHGVPPRKEESRSLRPVEKYFTARVEGLPQKSGAGIRKTR